MDTSKHTVTLPAKDYEEMKTWHEARLGVLDMLKGIHEISEKLIDGKDLSNKSPIKRINGLSEIWKQFS